MKIVSVAQMQKAERECASFGISIAQLMENAGRAVAEEIRRLYGSVEKLTLTVLVGPGNNGGDGLVAARYLHDWRARVNVVLCGRRSPEDPNLALVQQRGISCLDVSLAGSLASVRSLFEQSSAILDAVFGTGTSRPISGIYADILGLVNQVRGKRSGMKIIALDLPSGLNADTGAVDPVTPYADYTITLGFPKIGLFNLPGSERAGNIIVTDIGIPAELVEYINIELLTDDDVRKLLPERPLISHKGTFGRVLAITGSLNYPGAAFLACSGTIRIGAGLTTLAIASSLLPVLAAKLNEVVYLPLPESSAGIVSASGADQIKDALSTQDVLLVGCGIGQHPETALLFKKVLFETEGRLPLLVLDADGLNLLAKIPDWQVNLKYSAILTPHAGEMSRLTGKHIDEIQKNRLRVAKEAAEAWRQTVVLKGAYTVIAALDGQIRVSPFANPGLATAGTGDVLAGTIAGLLAQGLSPFAAAICGVYLHGKAGEIIKGRLGDTGMVASDLLPVLPIVIHELRSG
ncbi:MAG: NAD(P)H-hydrate dehydratase [Dehalococcoidales bacterium]|jgi:NAD(P)H-hydrate epimerase|nr:NAD(P)H-hydrate dehydratase [Dehalococcoidales bacterium]